MPPTRLALASVALLALPALAMAGTGPAPQAEVVPFGLDVDGIPARGLLGVPAGRPTALVVFCHGHGQTAEVWRAHLLEAAGRGALAVAMDYSPWFDLDRGAAETNAAARLLAERHGIRAVALFGVSMGGTVSGLALAEAPQRDDGSDLYTWWVDVEGLTALAETWAEATATNNEAAGQIEAETGGTPAEVPLEYVRRSAGYRALDIRERVAGAVVVHAVNDGKVPYNQGRAMADALRAAAVPTDVYTALRGDPGDLGSTLTDALAGGLPNPLHLTGHGWEGSRTHLVMRTAFDALWGLLDHTALPSNREVVVDEHLGRLPAA